MWLTREPPRPRLRSLLRTFATLSQYPTVPPDRDAFTYIAKEDGVYAQLAREFIVPAGQVRPIPFLRGDWFASIATQPPLYNDFLQLPRGPGLGITVNEAALEDYRERGA